MSKQKTIQNEVVLEGVGLHTGAVCKIVLKPAEVNTGITFIRVDGQNSIVIKAELDNIYNAGAPSSKNFTGEVWSFCSYG